MYYLIASEVISLNCPRYLNMPPSFSLVIPQALALWYQPWITSTPIWQQWPKTTLIRPQFVLRWQSGRQPSTGTTTKRTTPKSIELRWVLEQFVSFLLVHYWLSLSSSPSSQALVFQDSWMEWWVDRNSSLNCSRRIWSYICIYGHRQGYRSNNQGTKTSDFLFK